MFEGSYLTHDNFGGSFMIGFTTYRIIGVNHRFRMCFSIEKTLGAQNSSDSSEYWAALNGFPFWKILMTHVAPNWRCPLFLVDKTRTFGIYIVCMFKTIGHDPREFRRSNSWRACGDFNITMETPKQIEQHPANVIKFTCYPSVNQHRCGKPHHLKIIFQGQAVASFALGG
jgi:hypothetical protein